MKVPTARFGEHRLAEQVDLPVVGLGDGFSWKSKDLEQSASWRATAGKRPRPTSSRASFSSWCWTKSPTR
jgi:hypothetical protein